MNRAPSLPQKPAPARRRDAFLRAARFERPAFIPLRYAINGACWAHYSQEALEEIMASHPLLFPEYQPLPKPFRPNFLPDRCAGQPYTDEWGCVWRTTEDGIMGTVVSHPLADWEALERFVPPAPSKSSGRGPLDWERVARDFLKDREAGRLVGGGLRHGHMFLTLSDLRGYQNLLCDMADDDPRLRRLIAIVEDFNLELVRRYLELGVDWMSYPEDLGMQRGPMLSPAHFRLFIKPSYQRLMQPSREQAVVVHMHSDGDIRALADDVLDCGVEIFNVQDLVNGIDWIAAHLKGRVCVELDIDRQQITCFGTPAEIDAHIRHAVTALGSREGGLMLCYGLYPGTPIRNARAVADAMEMYCSHFS